MSNLRLILADDEAPVREALSEILKLYGTNIEVVAQCDSVSSTVTAIKELTPDVVLLDIEMREGTGFDVLKQFPSPKFKVVFITAYQEYAVQAFRFAAIDYILKPVDPDQLIEAINKAEDLIDREKISLKIDSFLYNMDAVSKGLKKIVLKTSDNIHIVNIQNILYCEADRGYTNFYLNDKSRIMVSNTLGQYEELLSDYGFLRIHASYLINMNHISRYEKGDGGKVFLDTGIVLPVAIRKKEQLLSFLSKL